MNNEMNDGGATVPCIALLDFPDSLDIANASRSFEDEQGNVSPTHSFQAGAYWMMEEVKSHNPKNKSNTQAHPRR